MIYYKKPKNFKKKFAVTACFLECDKEFLILHRSHTKPQGDTWGLPAGKIHHGETPVLSILREISEETGYKAREDELNNHGKMYVKYPEYDFEYYLFLITLKSKPKITINFTEHQAYKWVTPKIALSMELIRDFDSQIRFFYGVE